MDLIVKGIAAKTSSGWIPQGAMPSLWTENMIRPILGREAAQDMANIHHRRVGFMSRYGLSIDRDDINSSVVVMAIHKTTRGLRPQRMTCLHRRNFKAMRARQREKDRNQAGVRMATFKVSTSLGRGFERGYCEKLLNVSIQSQWVTCLSVLAFHHHEARTVLPSDELPQFTIRGRPSLDVQKHRVA